MRWRLRWWLTVLLVLPLRWLIRHLRDALNQRQMCKRCGRTMDEIDFIVSDRTWAEVVPPRWQKRVLCLRCFEDLARAAGVRCVKLFLVNGP